MKRLSALIVLLCVVGISLTPFPLNGQAGVYNTFSGLYWCETPRYCLHEIGHKLDHDGNWPSRTPEFSKAVAIYIFTEAKEPGVSVPLYKLLSASGVITWNGYFTNSPSEIYAAVFQMSDGKQENMPEIFRPFYDWREAESLLQGR